MNTNTLTRCDYCGGPARWTIAPHDGEVYFQCKTQCDGFMQMELLEDSWVSSPMESGDAADSVRPEVDTCSDSDEAELPF